MKTIKGKAPIILWTLLVIILMGCGSTAGTSSDSINEAPRKSESAGATGESTSGATARDPSEINLEERGPESPSDGTLGEAMGDSTAKSSSLELPSRPEAAEMTEALKLEAGEIDDNRTWEEYLEFINKYQGPPVIRMDISNRHLIQVTDPNGRPVPNALIEIVDPQIPTSTIFKAKTYSDGRTVFHPRGETPDEFNLKVTTGQQTSKESFSASETEWKVVLETRQDPDEKVSLDIMFLLDSTGSMADEIGQIQANLLSIAKQVNQLPEAPDLRFAAVSYRDRGDDYVTRLFDFDNDPQSFSRTIQDIRADGGDDYPEALNEGFRTAVKDADWRHHDPLAVRLIFLIADAPPTWITSRTPPTPSPHGTPGRTG